MFQGEEKFDVSCIIWMTPELFNLVIMQILQLILSLHLPLALVFFFLNFNSILVLNKIFCVSSSSPLPLLLPSPLPPKLHTTCATKSLTVLCLHQAVARLTFLSPIFTIPLDFLKSWNEHFFFLVFKVLLDICPLPTYFSVFYPESPTSSSVPPWGHLHLTYAFFGASAFH